MGVAMRMVAKGYAGEVPPIPGEPTTHNSEAIPHLAKDTQNRCHELGGSKPEVAKDEEHFNSYAIKEVGPAKD